jgi:hypothetical protein
MQTVVVILERDACRLGMALDEDATVTLIAVASEDPSCWDDIVASWARYRSPQVPEFVSRVADFQSRIDDQFRSPNWDSDIPF